MGREEKPPFRQLVYPNATSPARERKLGESLIFTEVIFCQTHFILSSLQSWIPSRPTLMYVAVKEGPQQRREHQEFKMVEETDFVGASLMLIGTCLEYHPVSVVSFNYSNDSGKGTVWEKIGPNNSLRIYPLDLFQSQLVRNGSRGQPIPW